MSIFTKIEEALHPIQKIAQDAGHTFDPKHLADLLKQAIVQPIKGKIDGHAIVQDVLDTLEVAQPSAIKVDLFASIEVALGIDLSLEFGMGITIEQPVDKIGNLTDLIEHPPATVHQLCDKLWGIVPTEIRMYEKGQAVFGIAVEEDWFGEDVMTHVVQFLDKRGWLEHKLRP